MDVLLLYPMVWGLGSLTLDYLYPAVGKLLVEMAPMSQLTRFIIDRIVLYLDKFQ